MSNTLAHLCDIARTQCPRILLPEADDERILEAAAQASRDGIAQPVLFGPRRKTGRLHDEFDSQREDIEFLPYPDENVLDTYAATYADLRGVDPAVAKRLLNDDLTLGALLLRLGEVDGMVAGATHSTAEVVAVANGLVGLDPSIETASSYFIMQFPDKKIGEDGVLLYADCGVNIDPSEDQLADIAITTANTTEELFGWQPRVAMLSFSTKGSASHETSKKVARAATEAQDCLDDAIVDGELQADVALVPDVAERKLADGEPIRGDANIFIFPNLDAGNIAYKLTERLAGATALGPILQGYAQPLSDLSRGASTDDICDIIGVTAAQVARHNMSGDGEILPRGLLRRRESELAER